MKNILFLLVLLSFASCVTQRRCNEKFPQVQSVNVKDSTVIRDSIALRYDTIPVYFPVPKLQIKDSVAIRYEYGVAASDKLILRGNFSEAIVQVKEGKLSGTLTESGVMKLRVGLIMQDHYIKELRQKQSDKTIVIKEEYVSPFKWFQIWGFRLIVLIAALCYGIPILVKFAKKLL